MSPQLKKIEVPEDDRARVRLYGTQQHHNDLIMADKINEIIDFLNKQYDKEHKTKKIK